LLDVIDKIHAETQKICPWKRNDTETNITTISDYIEKVEKGGYVQVIFNIDSYKASSITE